MSRSPLSIVRPLSEQVPSHSQPTCQKPLYHQTYGQLAKFMFGFMIVKELRKSG